MPTWAGPMLKAAGIYNMVWGAWIVLYPLSFFNWTQLPLPNYPMIWQSVGMIVGVYGVGYFIASFDPMRHWPIILVGFMGKVFGPIGAVYYGILGTYPWIFGLHNITNDIIWLVPFALVLYAVWFDSMHTAYGVEGYSTFREGLKAHTHSDGTSLYDHSYRKPLFLLFLRHTGCTFCREALAELASKRKAFESKGIVPVVIHMGENEDNIFEHYGLSDIEKVSDPTCKLYRAFNIQRGSNGLMFGFQEWIRGFKTAILQGHGIGLPIGDAYRLSGAFLIHQGVVIKTWHAHRASEPVPMDAVACDLPSLKLE